MLDLAQTQAVGLSVLGSILKAIAILALGSWAVALIVKILVATSHRGHLKPAIIDLIAAMATAAGWVFIAAGILQALNLNELAIAVGGSISLVTLGIASAASGNLGDIIAGVFLASDPDFGNGFTVKTGDIRGTIERIDLRKTRLRADDGKLHIIPNKAIESTVWIVEARPPALPPIQRPPLFHRGQRKAGDEQQAPSEPT